MAYEIRQSCDFIFDEQGKIGQDAVAMWEVLTQVVKANAAQGRSDFGPHLGERPVFRDDKLFLPLQAADLYAWHVRRAFFENKVLHAAPRKVMRDLAAVSTVSRHVDERELANFRDYIERGGAVFAAQNPNVELVGYQGTEAQQRAARVAARAATKGRRNRS